MASSAQYSRLETDEDTTYPPTARTSYYPKPPKNYLSAIFAGIFMLSVLGSIKYLSHFWYAKPAGKWLPSPFHGKVRGVNLGGWLVLEPWITPSLFDETGNAEIVDEWTFGKLQEHETAVKALTTHWDSFITEEDFRQIKAAGLNHVRLPIGYWAFQVDPNEPYLQGQLPYVHKAIEWARNHHLKLILDLHGAPGSQNGFDNSGQRMPRPTWHRHENNVARTRAVLKEMALLFLNQSDVVTTIAPLNEPAGFYGRDILAVTRKFWQDSHAIIRFPLYPEVPPAVWTNSHFITLIHDAFQPLRHWDSLLSESRWENAAMDTHLYQMFSVAGNQLSFEDHITSMRLKGPELAKTAWRVVVGEWTPAVTDCAKYLNGRGVGSRYAGSHPENDKPIGDCRTKTGKGSDFSEEEKHLLKRSWVTQVETYENYTEGWVQWTWKTEQAHEWSYKAGLEYGWIPKDLTKNVGN